MNKNLVILGASKESFGSLTDLTKFTFNNGKPSERNVSSIPPQESTSEFNSQMRNRQRSETEKKLFFFNDQNSKNEIMNTDSKDKTDLKLNPKSAKKNSITELEDPIEVNQSLIGQIETKKRMKWKTPGPLVKVY